MSAFFAIKFTGSKDNLYAEVYFKDQIVEKIDLEKEDEIRTFPVTGLHGIVEVQVKHNAVRVLSSNCPEQHCVHTGWVEKSNGSIVCAYNAIYVLVISDNSSHDIEV